MEQEVYVDLYFLVNACMDMLCLMLSAALLHRYIPRLRAILAAVFGGAYAVAALLLGLDGILGFLLDSSVALLMCVIGFAGKKIPFRRILQTTAVYILVSMMLGGIMTALYAALNRLNLPLDSLQGDGLSVWTFALLTAVAGFATARGGRWFGRANKTKSITVTAILFGQEVTLCALVDSGNLLEDPLSGKSVIVAERECLRSVLPPKLFRACAGRDVTTWLSEYEHAHKIRLIPTQTATGETILPALLPDRLQITDGKETYTADYLIAIGDLGERARDFDAVIALH